MNIKVREVDTEVVVSLKYRKSTKGTHVYESKEENAPIPSLYLKKTLFKPRTTPPPSLSR